MGSGLGLGVEGTAVHVRKLAPGERERAEKYLFLDEEQLYSLIPPYLTEHDGARFSPEGQREAGKRWFERIRGPLRKTLCDDWEMCRRIDDPEVADATNLVVVIGDAVATQVTTVPPILVAAIIVRIGARRFCNCP